MYRQGLTWTSREIWENKIFKNNNTGVHETMLVVSIGINLSRIYLDRVKILETCYSISTRITW